MSTRGKTPVIIISDSSESDSKPDFRSAAKKVPAGSRAPALIQKPFGKGAAVPSSDTESDSDCKFDSPPRKFYKPPEKRRPTSPAVAAKTAPRDLASPATEPLKLHTEANRSPDDHWRVFASEEAWEELRKEEASMYAKEYGMSRKEEKELYQSLGGKDDGYLSG